MTDFKSITLFWRYYRSVIIIVVIGTILTGIAMLYQHQSRLKHTLSILELRAKDEAAHVQQNVDKIIEIMESIRSFYAASEYVDRNEFRQFVQSRLSRNSEIRALEWAPLVLPNARFDIEKELSNIITGRGITERDDTGQLVPALKRNRYYPVFYVEPLEGNETVLGFDINSNLVRSDAIQASIARKGITFSDKIQLVQGNGRVSGVLLLQPIYKYGASIASQSLASNENLLGIAVGVIEHSKLIENSLRNFQPTGLDILLVDNYDSASPDILYFHPSRTRNTNISQPSLKEFLLDRYFQVSINIPEKKWVIYFKPAPAFEEEHASNQVWHIFLVGFILTLMLAYNMFKRVRYTQDLLYQAQHDALTGLSNRVLFREKLTGMISQYKLKTSGAILFLDLDNFKHINDSLGHATGDMLLVEVAKRLSANIRVSDDVARMGGDEFIILAKNIKHEQDIINLVNTILEKITKPYSIAERIFYLSASVGISLYPKDGNDAEALISNADAAMYQAKSLGRNRYYFYSEELTEKSLERVQLEVELHKALKNKELQAFYQPQIDLKTGTVIGAEALARWTHKTFGKLSPEQFIPIAEESGLIIELGEIILLQACKQAKKWIEGGSSLKRIAVNVSVIQLQSFDFVSRVKNILDRSALEAKYLEIELTESIFMRQAEQSIDNLKKLGAMGVSLAIDDFGTGHSSLTYLKRLPIDKLKIDRSFVQNIPVDEEDVAITSGIIALAKSLNLNVIAEGVESDSQRDFLLKLGCKEVQGYLHGHPVSAEEFVFEA